MITREEFIEELNRIGWKISEVEHNEWIINHLGKHTSLRADSEKIQLEYPEPIFGAKSGEEYASFGAIVFSYKSVTISRHDYSFSIVCCENNAVFMSFRNPDMK